jgi:hypothetical protein
VDAIRLPKPVVGTVESFDGSTAHLVLEDGEQRVFHAPEQILVEAGMSVRIQDVPDGSAPIVTWASEARLGYLGLPRLRRKGARDAHRAARTLDSRHFYGAPSCTSLMLSIASAA